MSSLSRVGSGSALPHLHSEYPALRDRLPWLRLGQGPSPVRPLDLPGPGEVWLKDESLYGDGPWGGNKVRKLEWLLPEARRRDRNILTFGGIGTNWGLATALYGREHGLHTALALIDQPRDGHVEDQLRRLRSSGATLHFTRTRNRTILAAPWLILRHTNGFRLPWILPSGGSSPLGTLGYVEAAFEIAGQVSRGELPRPGHAVVPAGSGGTAAGLALGFALAGLPTRVVGVIVSEHLPLGDAAISRLARRSARLLWRRGADLPEPDLDLTMTSRWLGPTYGAATVASERAMATARKAGLELDPVYTAKAMAGLLEMTAAGELGGGPVLFVNTDGPR